MALNEMRLYLNETWYEMGSNMGCSVKSKRQFYKGLFKTFGV